MAYETFDQQQLYPIAKTKANVSSIMSAIKKYSFAKANRYYIEFTLPTPLLRYLSTRDSTFSMSQQNERMNVIKMNCIQVTYPQRSLILTDNTYGAHDERVPNSYDQSPISISFYAFADMKEKLFFDYWVDLMYSVRERTVMFLDEVAIPEFFIYQLDSKNMPKYGVKLSKVLPTNVSVIQLDSQATEIPLRVDITLSYMYLDNFNYIKEE